LYRGIELITEKISNFRARWRGMLSCTPWKIYLPKIVLVPLNRRSDGPYIKCLFWKKNKTL
jgi:hypothetical protein